MGDEQRPLEPSDEVEEMKVSLHSTPRPLPDAILKMPRSATVCRYCGVSYLIYSEFHQLNTRIAQLEAVLHEARESALKEKAQREALELGMPEWERALKKQVEQKETHMREEFEEKSRHLKQAMTKEFEDKLEKDRVKREEDFQKINNETMQQLRREMETIESHKLATQKAELQAKSAEREKVLNDALQKVNKRLDDSREYSEQLEQRLAEAVATTQKVERQLEGEKKQCANLSFKHQQRQKALQRILSLLRSFDSDLTDVRGFLISLAGLWQAFSCQLQQQSAQVLSGIRHDLAHSAGELQKTTSEKERLTLQLMEQMALHKNSEMDYKATVLRVKSELERTHAELLSSQQRCDTLQEQLSTWQQSLEQTSGKYHAAEEEVTRLRVAVESAERDARDVRRDRDMLTESHHRALDELKDDYRNKLALKLSAALEQQRLELTAQFQQQMSAVHRETSLELSIHTEKNRTLLLQYQRDSTRLQQKLTERNQQVERLQTELEEERRSREEERRSEEHQSRKQEEKVQEERDMWRQQLHQAQTEVQTMTESNRLLQQEVAFLEETVRRECEEREQLTVALSRAQEQLVGLHSPSPRHTSSSKTVPGESLTRVPLSRSSTPPNSLSGTHRQTPPACHQSLSLSGGARQSIPCHPAVTTKETTHTVTHRTCVLSLWTNDSTPGL